MDTERFDSLTKDHATSATRRRALAGLGALALGGAGILGRSRAAAEESAENDRRRCIERCDKDNDDRDNDDRDDNDKRRRRCRRRCRRRNRN